MTLLLLTYVAFVGVSAFSRTLRKTALAVVFVMGGAFKWYCLVAMNYLKTCIGLLIFMRCLALYC